MTANLLGYIDRSLTIDLREQSSFRLDGSKLLNGGNIIPHSSSQPQTMNPCLDSQHIPTGKHHCTVSSLGFTTLNLVRKQRRISRPVTAIHSITTTSTAIRIAILLMISSLPSFTNAQLNLGCYASGLVADMEQGGGVDGGGGIGTLQGHVEFPILPGLSPPHLDIFMSQGACSAYCKTRQFMYAIIEGGTTCYCSSQRAPETNKVEDSKCDRPCVGYPLETCGSNLLDNYKSVLGSGRGAYANVLLVGSSLPTQPILPSSSPSTLPSHTSTFGDGDSIKGEDEKQLGATLPLSTLPPTPTETSPAAVAVIVGLKPEARNDSEETNDTSAQMANGMDDGGQDEEEGEGGGENKQGGLDKEVNEVDGEDGGDGADGADGADGIEGADGADGTDDGGEDDDPNPGNSGKATAGHGQKMSSSGIPVASTAVAVVCVLGICAFVVYAARKRKRARARAAWVDSIFGVGGQAGPNHNPYGGSNTHNNSANSRNTMVQMGYHVHQPDDLESVSDGASETTDMRPSMTVIETQRGSVLVADSYPRAIRTSVIIPASVRSSMGVPGRTYGHIQHGAVRYSRRARRRDTLSNEVMFYDDPYKEFYDQNGCEEDGELAHLADDYSLASPTVIASPAHAFAPTSQRPGGLVYSDGKGPSQNRRLSYGLVSMHSGHYQHQHQQQLHHQQRPIHPSAYPHNRQPLASLPQQHQSYQQAPTSSLVSPLEHLEYEDPVRDALRPLAVAQPRRRPHSQPHITHRHSMRLRSTPASGTSSGEPQSRPSVSDYRRPHSFTLGLTRRESGEEPISFRTHVLDDNDGESLNSEVEHATSKYARRVTSSGATASVPRRLSGTLKQHFKRLSFPYVQAIRQQQQEHVANSPSCIEEGLGGGVESDGAAGGGNGCESLMPVPGQAPCAERRWSRGLLKGVVFGAGSSIGSKHTKDQVAVAAAAGDGQIEEMGDAVGATGTPVAVGHRQAHSGSLASFRGLDDPNHPQLRVMNPDDGA